MKPSLNVQHEYQQILATLQNPSNVERSPTFDSNFTGSERKTYQIRNPVLRNIAKDWLKTEANKATEEVLALVDLLFTGRSHEERKLASFIIGYRKDIRQQVTMAKLDNWLDELTGWAEIDSLCQNNFLAPEILGRWAEWQKLLSALSSNQNINKRRASLVFLVGPTRKSNDHRLHEMAYANIEALKSETDKLITKAISWLLRSMTNSNKEKVADYLRKQAATLPNIAVRETTKQLAFGKLN